MREQYSSPVGFASEPAERRRHILGRVVTLLLLAFVGWLAWNRVVHTTDDQGGSFNPTPAVSQSSLPGGF